MSECADRTLGQSDLRTRIIAALLSEDDVALMADAVMGLFTEECRNGPIVGSRDMLTRTGYKVARHRYVTDWETD